MNSKLSALNAEKVIVSNNAYNESISVDCLINATIILKEATFFAENISNVHITALSNVRVQYNMTGCVAVIPNQKLSADSVTDSTVYGDVNCENLSGSTVYGDVNCENLSGSTVYGDVGCSNEIRESDIYGNVKAKTIIGKIKKNMIKGNVWHSSSAKRCTIIENYVLGGSADSYNIKNCIVFGNINASDAYNSIFLSQTTDNYVNSSSHCRFINIPIRTIISTNCEFINCKFTPGISNDAIQFCTFVNCVGYVKSASHSIYWNCSGTIAPYKTNAQTEHCVDNLLTLDADNSIARFINTGFWPAQGIQDVGLPPYPNTDPQGFQNWIDQFGDFRPASNSFLKGLTPLDSNVPTDIDGTTRLSPTTPGAYETLNK